MVGFPFNKTIVRLAFGAPARSLGAPEHISQPPADTCHPYDQRVGLSTFYRCSTAGKAGSFRRTLELRRVSTCLARQRQSPQWRRRRVTRGSLFSSEESLN